MGGQDLGSKTLHALKWGYGGAAARALAQLLIQTLLARLLGPEAFGQAMAAVLVMSIGWILSEGGFGTALIQKSEIDDGDIGLALGWVLLLSSATGLAVVLASPWLARWLGGSELQGLIMAAGLLIPLQALANIPASLMRRRFDVRRSQLIFLVSYVVVYGCVGLPLAWAGAGPWALIVAAGLQTLANLLGNYAAVRHTLRMRLRGAQGLAHFGLQVTGSNVMGWIGENTDRFLVNRYWGVQALGEYSAALSLSRAPAGMLVSAAQSVTLVSAARLQDDPERLGRNFLALLGVATLATGPLFTLMAMHGPAIVQLLYGNRWAHAGPLFSAFCASLPFYSVLAVSGPVLWAINAVRQDTLAQVCTFAVLALGFYGLRSWPLTTVAWLVPLVYLLRTVWIYTALALRLRLAHRRALRAVAGALALSALVGAVSLACSRVLPPLAAMAAATALSLVLALAALRLWPQALLAPEFVALLCNRARDSAGLARLCRLLRLQPAA